MADETPTRDVKVRIGRRIVIDAFQGTVPEGKVFLCWATNADGTGNRYRPGQKIVLSGDMRLYPVFGDAVDQEEVA